MELSVILPTYNEKENIGHVISELETLFSGEKTEIIVVDDSSPDGTAHEVEKMQKRFQNLRLIKDCPKEGIGKALKRGYDSARGKWLFSMDADRAFMADDIKRVLSERKNGVDFIVGSKYSKGANYVKNSLTAWLRGKISEYGNRYIGFASGVPLRDFSMNFRLLKKEVWENIKPEDAENFFLVEMIVQAHSRKFNIKEIGVSLLPRDYGESKTRVGKQAGKFIVKSTAFLLKRLQGAEN